MRKQLFAALFLAASFVLSASSASARRESPASGRNMYGTGFRQALSLYDRGMYDRARIIFESVSGKDGDVVAEGYAVLCAVRLQTEGYERLVDRYIAEYPYSSLIPEIRFCHALVLFDRNDYKGALESFEKVQRHELPRSLRPEYGFKKAYCDFSLGNYDRAMLRFRELENRTYSDYTAPARYAIGYMYYRQKQFAEAADWFGKSVKDSRFASMSNYYIIECRFMLGDHEAVCKDGPDMIEKVPQERQSHVVRLISESWLVLGDADKARYWFDKNRESSEIRTRSDFFYAGSVLYAVDDYGGAIDNYSMMTDRTDSLGQIANYHLGYCYIQTKNKVAALESFKAASLVSYDPDMAEDAYFNYAKLAFDLNNDTSVFNDYLKKYSDADKGERINSYIAVAALYSHDYETAIDAYGKIDELEPEMKANYMKANYLRASQLIERGSYRDAVPYLKAAAYYSDKRTMFNQLSRFWIAESFYRNDQFDTALELYTDLYNISALYGMKEGYLIPFNMAYCHFKKENYSDAARWFQEYLSSSSVEYRKEAMLRHADCLFMQEDYAGAIKAYESVLKDYFRADDIYPYYRAAVAYGLEGNNAKKISLLENAEKASSSAQFYPEAMFELGRSCVTGGLYDRAIRCFDRLIGTVRDSVYIAKSMIELGMVYANSSENGKALGYYKKVVEDFPLSGMADDALLAIEALYQSMNRPEEYLSYIESIGKSDLKTEDERELMIFNAAQQIYLSENYRKALLSLQSYIDKFPNGSKVHEAEFYIAECYRSTGDKEKACDYYAKVVDSGSASFREIAMLGFSVISYELQRYEDALGGYSSLYASAQLDNNRHEALVGMMRSAYNAKHFEETIEYASGVKADTMSDKDLLREADYIRAKSYLATSRRNEAFAILDTLAAEPCFAEGAEASWLIIQDCYDRGEFEQVENKVYNFSDAQTGQTYWLAKAFIVLGDSFAERGDFQQAEATFKSIEEGYTPLSGGDDVMDNVKMRLERLSEMMSEPSDSLSVTE